MLRLLKRLFRFNKNKVADPPGTETLRENDFQSEKPLLKVDDSSYNETKSTDLPDKDNSVKKSIIYSEDLKNLDKTKKAYIGRVIAIANQKGGVGKSTTAVNMSGYLGSMGYKTLLIDFDPQSNSTSGLGINKDLSKENIYDVIISNKNPKEVIMQTEYKNLFIIPSSIQLAGAEVELVSIMKREYKLKQAIDMIKEDFDFIIVDCPPALGLLTINALAAATEVLIPIQCEYYALEGLGQLVNTINLIKENLNEHLFVTGVVMTMYDGRTRLSEQVINEVKNYFPDKIYATIIPRNVRLSEAPSYGKPIIDYDPECKGAMAYKQLTEEVIKNVAK